MLGLGLSALTSFEHCYNFFEFLNFDVVCSCSVSMLAGSPLEHYFVFVFFLEDEDDKLMDELYQNTSDDFFNSYGAENHI